ncbi:MAG: putative Ig domain-containing protein [Endozoicomonas sp.]
MTRLRINGSRAFGVRPGSPVLFKVPAVGLGALVYTADNLPEGLQINAENGVISGAITEQGEYACTIHVRDDSNEVQRELLFVVGENICLTPFMGWNSWYCHSELISEKAVREVADMMVEKDLVNHGWTYVNIDDCWQAVRKGVEPLQPNERFSDMAAMCDYIHEKGLKAGIYHTPWLSTYAGFSGGSIDPEARSKELPEQKRRQKGQLYGRYPAVMKKKLNRVGSQWLFDVDVKPWAEWGIDFVKLDWNPNDVPTTRRMFSDLRNIGRDIVISLSNEAPFENAEGLQPYSHSLRTTSDIEAWWWSIARNFKQQEPWLQYIRPGYWPDPDMLQVGNIGTPNRQNTEFKPTRLSRDEQRSQMSLWCLLSAPLLITCDLASMDDFILGLLTNDDAIDINQDYPAQPPVREILGWMKEVWRKPLHDGHLAVGIFNRAFFKRSYVVDFEKLGLACKPKVVSVWDGKVYDTGSGPVRVKIPRHGVSFWKTVD